MNFEDSSKKSRNWFLLSRFYRSFYQFWPEPSNSSSPLIPSPSCLAALSEFGSVFLSLNQDQSLILSEKEQLFYIMVGKRDKVYLCGRGCFQRKISHFEKMLLFEYFLPVKVNVIPAE